MPLPQAMMFADAKAQRGRHHPPSDPDSDVEYGTSLVYAALRSVAPAGAAGAEGADACTVGDVGTDSGAVPCPGLGAEFSLAPTTTAAVTTCQC